MVSEHCYDKLILWLLLFSHMIQSPLMRYDISSIFCNIWKLRSKYCQHCVKRRTLPRTTSKCSHELFSSGFLGFFSILISLFYFFWHLYVCLSWFFILDLVVLRFLKENNFTYTFFINWIVWNAKHIFTLNYYCMNNVCLHILFCILYTFWTPWKGNSFWLFQAA